ncbi:MAG: ATP-binding protein [Vicinamibacterales bacterium]
MRLPTIRIPRLYRRAILIYFLTIVVPVCALLWLGIQSFNRQRQALATLTAEKLAAAVEARTAEAAARALQDRVHPIAEHYFVAEGGEIIRPALRAPLPQPAPPEFAAAERLELEANRPDLALPAYRRLVSSTSSPALALSGVARCQARLGDETAARATWREIAAKYPDARDLSHRPYGIVAALAAGDSSGLFEQITAGRWDLPADQAEYFLDRVAPGRSTSYLDQFHFARQLAAEFRAPGGLRAGELRDDSVAGRRIFYRVESPDRIAGLVVSRPWAEAIRGDLERELGVADAGTSDIRLYGGAVALVSLLLLAGVVLLARDTSREARVNQLRAEFVSGVSHELKTPITLVRLYGETLLRHDLPEEQRREFYRIITRESTRLGRLVDQILAFSRIERGDLHYELREGDVAPVVAGVLEDYRDWLEHAGFVVRPSVPESAPSIRFDPVAVSQALVNLLDNAAKYSGASREIGVRLDVKGPEVVIEVEDHGVGIAAHEQARIFDRFYRAAGRSGKGGYGLGLFMVRHIMDVHGGRAEVDSEPGRGSRFRLVFPTVPA